MLPSYSFTLYFVLIHLTLYFIIRRSQTLVKSRGKVNKIHKKSFNVISFEMERRNHLQNVSRVKNLPGFEPRSLASNLGKCVTITP